MANIKVGVTEARKMAELLDRDFDSMEEASKAALELAWEIYEAKAKFVCVAQVYFDGGYLSSADGRASKVVLGPYGTEAVAKTAGESLALSKASGCELRWWLLPIEHGTPSAWHLRRKEEREAEILANTPDPKAAAVEWAAKQPGWPGNEERAA